MTRKFYCYPWETFLSRTEAEEERMGEWEWIRGDWGSTWLERKEKKLQSGCKINIIFKKSIHYIKRYKKKEND